MILDNNSLLSDDQAIVATANSTDFYDLLATGKLGYQIQNLASGTVDDVQVQRNMGKGQMIPFMCQVTEDFDALTDLTFIFQSDDDSGFGAAEDVFSLTVPLAKLVAGFQIPIDKIPRGLFKRYFRMRYVVNGANPTVGRISAGIVAGVDGAYRG